MENVEEINQKIAKNLACYRKAAGLTQAELAEKISYSDKSVSKWESGNGIPDLYVLLKLAELYGVTLDDLAGKDAEKQAERITEERSKKDKKALGLHILIMLLSSGVVWLVATCIFVGFWLWKAEGAGWLVFIYAIPVNAIVMIVYACIWKYRFLNFLSISTLIWTALTSLFLTFKMVYAALGLDAGALWCIFLLGIPLEVLEVLWAFFRTLFRKNKKSETDSKTAVEAGIATEKAEEQNA